MRDWFAANPCGGRSPGNCGGGAGASVPSVPTPALWGHGVTGIAGLRTAYEWSGRGTVRQGKGS